MKTTSNVKGSSNAKKVDFLPPRSVETVSNDSGLLFGVYFWRDQG